MFEKPREEGGPPVGEPLGMSERRCVCVPRCHAMPRSAFQRLMRWQMYNAWGGSPESLITDSTLGLSTHTYIHTPLNDPAMIIWLVDIPWPLLTYLPSFPLVPCLSAPGGGDGHKVISQLVYYFVLIIIFLLLLSSCG